MTSPKNITTIKHDDYEIEYDTTLKTFDYRAALLSLLLSLVIEDTISFCEGLPDEESLPDAYQRWNELWKHPEAQLEYLIYEGKSELWLAIIRQSLNVAADSESDE